MSSYITALGWIVALIGGFGIACLLGLVVVEQWYRLVRQTLCVRDVREACQEWRKKYPEKAAAFDARAEKAR